MKIGIIGLGLIGGSFAKSILKKTDNEVYGYDISEDTMLKGELLHSFTSRLSADNVGELDLLMISLYPRAVEEYLDKYGNLLKEGTIIMDCAGNKKNIVKVFEEASKKYPKLKFIACHPMAGREFSGIRYSTSNMFENASVLLCPVKAEIEDIASIKNLLLSLGFLKVIITKADLHDRVIAYTSQLCHLISSSYIKSPTALLHSGFSAGSYKDMTRISKLNSNMWTELMVDNKENLLFELDEMISHLQEYREAISKGDEVELKRLFDEGNEQKDKVDSIK